MKYEILSDLNETLRQLFLNLDGRNVSNELFDELAASLNAKVPEIYAKHGMKVERKMDRDFIIFLFNLLVESGAIELRGDTLGVVGGGQPAEGAVHKYGPDTAENATEANPTPDVGFPEGWGENLVGNFDASHWAEQFKILLGLKPEWATDTGYLTGWFANAIMTGYDKAKQEEFPVAERSEEDYVYVEFYDILRDEYAPRTAEVNNVVVKFNTLAAAKEFVKLNAFGDAFKTKYYRYYMLEPTTSFKKTELK